MYGENPQGGNEALLLGSNEIELGALNRGVSKVSLGVKPKTTATANYKEEGDDFFYLETNNTSSNLWNIEMPPKKGLYLLNSTSAVMPEKIYLYDAEGKAYKNTFEFNTYSVGKTLVFYHPEDIKSTYYAYFGSTEDVQLGGSKLSQDILITKMDGSSSAILNGIYPEYLGQVSSSFDEYSLVLTIYNPYPFTLNLAYRIENGDGQDVNTNSKNKFTFTGFPDVLLPGKSKEFTINFQDSEYSAGASYSVKCTMSAPEVSDFVLLFTGSSF